MKLLIAKKDNAGHWHKVAILSATNDGTRVVNIPARHRGQVETALAKQAARLFAAGETSLFVTTAGAEWRVDRVDVPAAPQQDWPTMKRGDGDVCYPDY